MRGYYLKKPQTDHLGGKGQISQGKEESNCNVITKQSVMNYFLCLSFIKWAAL